MTVNATPLGSATRRTSRTVNDTLSPGLDADEYSMKSRLDDFWIAAFSTTTITNLA
jgi:hypothetical protein